MSSRCLAPALLLALACRTPDLDGPQRALPEDGFDFYSGEGNVAGDYYFAVEHWRHPGSGQVVLLAAMIHFGDADYYSRVEEFLREADVVLTEGVGGAPALSPTSLYLAYALANTSRGGYLGGLVPQGAAFDAPRAENGDFSESEFIAGIDWTTTCLTAVALPFLVVLTEPAHFGRWLSSCGNGLAGNTVADEAAFRHWLALEVSEDSGEPALLPGALERRNERLLTRLDAVLQRPGVQTVAMPWGADHMSGIAAGLAQRGFAREDHEWLRGIAVRSYLDGSSADPDGGRHRLFVPCLLDLQSFERSWQFATLCDSVALGAKPGTFAASLLWGFLGELRLGPAQGESSVSLLPHLFGRPILFDWRRRGTQSRWRFLWLFQVGE